MHTSCLASTIRVTSCVPFEVSQNPKQSNVPVEKTSRCTATVEPVLYGTPTF